MIVAFALVISKYSFITLSYFTIMRFFDSLFTMAAEKCKEIFEKCGRMFEKCGRNLWKTKGLVALAWSTSICWMNEFYWLQIVSRFVVIILIFLRVRAARVFIICPKRNINYQHNMADSLDRMFFYWYEQCVS